MGTVIAHREVLAVFLDRTVQESITFFTTRMANTDPCTPPTSVTEDIEEWMYEDRGVGGRKDEIGSIRYSVLAVLVAFHLLIRQTRKVSIASALHVLLFELTPEQRGWLGMTSDLTGTRAEQMAQINEPEASDQERREARRSHDREYARLAKFTASMFACFDPSPFYKGDTLTRKEKAELKGQHTRQQGRRTRSKMTNALRKSILADPHHPDRRIDDATSDRNLERLHDLMNKIVALPATKLPPDNWAGDLATDETIVITLPKRAGHGTRDELLVSSDPDAYYWAGKRAKSDESETITGDGSDDVGFGYGLTFLVPVGRPYERRIPEIAVGIHIGKPTGGRTSAVAAAHERAKRHGLAGGTRQRRLIADRGYSAKDDWLPFLHQNGYQSVQDYAQDWKVDIAIPDTDANGRPAAGPRLINGLIRCPGAAGLGEEQMVRPHNETSGAEPLESIAERHRRVALLDALSMPVKQGLRPDKSKKRGRPKRDEEPSTWAITVQCPAALGLVNCPLVMRADGLRNPDKPDVPTPPQASNPALLPRACRQDHVTYHLPLTHAKRVQQVTWGSHAWADAYSPIRSSNERYHSQFKHRNSGGIAEAWLEMRGIAKSGLLFAIASSVTTTNLIRDFRSKQIQADGKASFGPREAMRRKRQQFLKDWQNR